MALEEGRKEEGVGWSVIRAEKGPRVRLCRERCLHDGVCLTTVRRAEGVAKREELAVKRPGEPLFRRWSSSPPLPPIGPALKKSVEPAELWHNIPILQTEARPKRRTEVERALCTVAH